MLTFHLKLRHWYYSLYFSFQCEIYTVGAHDLLIGCTPGLLSDRAKIMKIFNDIIFFKFNFREGLLYNQHRLALLPTTHTECRRIFLINGLHQNVWFKNFRVHSDHFTQLLCFTQLSWINWLLWIMSLWKLNMIKSWKFKNTGHIWSNFVVVLPTFIIFRLNETSTICVTLITTILLGFSVTRFGKVLSFWLLFKAVNTKMALITFLFIKFSDD